MKLTEKSFYQFARRYFVKNAFDGVLTILGVILGAFLSGVKEPTIVLFVGVSACIGMGVSGLWGTFFTETAERKKKLGELERAMLRKLGGTLLGKENRKESLLLGFIDGFSPFAMALIILSPFIAAKIGFIALGDAYLYSLVLIGVSLLGLGFFLGKISKTGMIKSGILMFLAGIAAATINLLLLVFLGP